MMTLTSTNLQGVSNCSIWIDDFHVLIGTTDGMISMVEIADQGVAEKSREATHTRCVRDMCNSAFEPSWVASCGDEGVLRVQEWNSRRSVLSVASPSAFGSIKWHSFHHGLLTATNDNGEWVAYDIRTNVLDPIHRFHMPKQNLFTHECYTHHDVLLGYGDGEIVQVDMRYTNRMINKVKDPFVSSVADIQYNYGAHTFVTSGMSDFTVWKHDSATHEAYVWSHGEPTARQMVGSEYCTHAVFLLDNKVFTTDRCGNIGLYYLGFDR